jgi:hypothetical protein
VTIRECWREGARQNKQDDTLARQIILLVIDFLSKEFGLSRLSFRIRIWKLTFGPFTRLTLKDFAFWLVRMWQIAFALKNGLLRIECYEDEGTP